MIQYSTQLIEDDDINSVVKAMREDWLTGGPGVDEFEHDFASYVDAKYAVAMSNCTAVLHASCNIINIQKGDEIITSPITMASSANAALYCGGRPVFADIDPNTYNINPHEVEKKITDKTKAIVAVDYAGQPCNLDALKEIAVEHNLILIEDSAHAAGASYKGKKVGSISDLTAFSFHPVKTMTTLEGGMVTTNRKDWYEKLKLFRAHGIIRTQEMMEKEGPWFSEQIFLGYNYRLTDVQCALGRSQLKKLDRFVSRRRECAKFYDENLKEISSIVIPHQDEASRSSYHLYPVLVPKERRREIFIKMREAGIGVSVQYYPVYKHKYYQEIGYRDVCCPVAEDFYAREITLPAHPKITNNDLQYIVDTLKKILL